MKTPLLLGTRRTSRVLWLILLMSGSGQTFGQISITFPYYRIVLQQNNLGQAAVFIKGQCPDTLDRVEARLVARQTGQGTTTAWQTVETTPISGLYSGQINGTGGWYDLQVRGITQGIPLGDTTTLTHVGIGEVFLIVGHSNAQGSPEGSVSSLDDRVSSVDFLTPEMQQQYNETADTSLLPFNYNRLMSAIAPFQGDAWYWGRLGDSLTTRLNVPILFYGAAFGGSSMQQTYKAAYNIPFTHGFINYSIRMPYVNIKNTLIRYAPVTGLRGVLSSHGVNDAGSSTSDFKFYSEQVVAKSRLDANNSTLAWMVAISAYNNGTLTHIVAAQQQQIAADPHAYTGPNLNLIDNTGRRDGLHFNEQGLIQASHLWAETLASSPFLTSATPMLSTAQSAGLRPVSGTSGAWTATATWRNGRAPLAQEKVFIKVQHSVQLNTSQAAKSLFLAGSLEFGPIGTLAITN